jgi:2,3-bisphosphoglycerate-independent phosphoglycerate mutase
MKQVVTLVVLDGWGIGEKDETNPIYKANLPTIEFIEKNFPKGALQASGLALGLPYDEEGNSELGHLTIGAGRIVGGHLPRISKAIEDGSFFKNENFVSLINWVKKYNSRLHLIGLLTEGEVHASLRHLKAILNFFKKNGFEDYYLHLISDGRDSAPRSFLSLVNELSSFLGFDITQKIASILGRYYAMDRDKHWDRIEKAYKVLIGEGEKINSLEDALNSAYNQGLNDEYVECFMLENKPHISENDAVFFFNFREDRMRELTACFVKPDFNYFPVKKFSNLLVVSMTLYEKDFTNPVIFSPHPLEQTLGEVLYLNGKTQLRIAETEKYAHVTYFFNGLKEDPFPQEYRILIPSLNVFRYNEHPEMMARPITDRVLTALTESTYDFILLNYANPDMVAHTGDFEATKKAVEIVDRELGRIVNIILQQGHICIITSDHGNAERLLGKEGEMETKHDPNPVPLYLVSKKFQKQRKTNLDSIKTIGMLSDVAPTILELMNINQPPLMTGQSLLYQLLED